MSRFEIFGKSSLEQIEKERSEQLYDKPVREGENIERALSKINLDGLDQELLESWDFTPVSHEVLDKMMLELELDFKNERKKEIEKRSTLRNEQLSIAFSQKSNHSDYEQDISLGGPKR